MTFSFDGQHGLIIIEAELEGLTGVAILRLGLDTGATRTLINLPLLVAMGYDPAGAAQKTEAATASGVELVPLFDLLRLSSLGQERRSITVIGHTLPSSAGIDGLLGLDFLRGHTLTVDFRKGEIVLG